MLNISLSHLFMSSAKGCSYENITTVAQLLPQEDMCIGSTSPLSFYSHVLFMFAYRALSETIRSVCGSSEKYDVFGEFGKYILHNIAR